LAAVGGERVGVPVLSAADADDAVAVVSAGPRVLLVAHYASERLGGEAAIPLNIFRQLRGRGVPVWMVTHDSGRAELTGVLAAADLARVTFVPSLPGGRRLLSWGERQADGPRSVAWALTQVERQLAMLPTIRRLVREHRISVVHQAVGVAPSAPSPLLGLGAPLVVGPLNGSMSMPPAFRGRDGRSTRVVQALRPVVTGVANRLLPGKLRAGAVLVANERTRRALPSGLRGRVDVLSENGVHLHSWPPKDYDDAPVSDGACRLVFLGRLVAWKGVDLLLEAMTRLDPRVVLEIVGTGPERDALHELAARLGLSERVRFAGWVPADAAARRMRAADVLVLPALRESGGAVVLEAMASALPVVVAGWGGPDGYVDDSTGIRVDVSDRSRFVTDLAQAIGLLAARPELRRAMGESGREKVEASYDRNVLTDRLLDIYRRENDDG